MGWPQTRKQTETGEGKEEVGTSKLNFSNLSQAAHLDFLF